VRALQSSARLKGFGLVDARPKGASGETGAVFCHQNATGVYHDEDEANVVGLGGHGYVGGAGAGG